MKPLFSLLLVLTVFFSTNAQSKVCIKPQTARYFLEADDERWLLREKDSLQSQRILILTDELLTKNQIISTYKTDSTIYKSIEVTFIDEIRLINQENDILKRKLKSQKLLNYLGALGIIIALIL